MRIKSILVPIDFSDMSLTAARDADELARKYRASLTLLHVHRIIQGVFMDAMLIEPPGEMADMVTETQRKLEKLVTALQSPSQLKNTNVVLGDPVKMIVNESRAFDLLVIGSRGRSGWTEFLLGSVAERVIRAARCAVLVIKPEKETP